MCNLGFSTELAKLIEILFTKSTRILTEQNQLRIPWLLSTTLPKSFESTSKHGVSSVTITLAKRTNYYGTKKYQTFQILNFRKPAPYLRNLRFQVISCTMDCVIDVLLNYLQVQKLFCFVQNNVFCRSMRVLESCHKLSTSS